MGNAQKQQEEMKHKLAVLTVNAEAGDGAVKVTANANREILDISFDTTKMDWNDLEQVQDLVLTAVNRALELAQEKEQAEAQELLKNMLPPGFGGLAGMFD